MLYAEIYFDLSLDHGFDYLIPEEMRAQVQPGTRVRVPLGHSERSGYVIKLKDSSDCKTIRPILFVESEKEQIPQSLLKLGDWICNYYCAPREHALRMLLPAVVRSGEMKHRQVLFVCLTPKATTNLNAKELTPRQHEILGLLLKKGAMAQPELLEEIGTTVQTLQRLEDDGWIQREKRVVERNPYNDILIQPDSPKKLTEQQQKTKKAVDQSVQEGNGQVFLLHGCTGSGKTEVYLQCIQHCLECGKEAIVLVPEISLTPQTCDRFRRRFGNRVSVLHSALGDGERFDEWTRIREGRSQIVVGARSALFAPFQNLGLIVVDEEHENTYKQDESPRYNARDIAVVRGKFEHATVVLGSATPSMESYKNCLDGRYTLLEMPDRIDGAQLPTVELVDMTQETAATGQAQLFSRRLKDKISDRLYKGEQVILFLNRRGFATQLICPQCGYVSQCSNCSVTHTYHRKENLLVCHMCGEEKLAPDHCPQCGGEGIRYTGVGTEKIESIVRGLFPDAHVARMDADTMTKKDAYRTVLGDFRSGKIQILIGTQMIAKGLDFPNVTLVGVIQADSTLYLSDFRSGERTFQLITQVAGRAGRGDTPGLVIVQTYTPYHYALRYAVNQDFKGFYNEEYPNRNMVGFPPATHMVMLHFRSADQNAARQSCEHFARLLVPLLPQVPGVQLIGPKPAEMERIKTKYRYQILLRGGNIVQLTKLLRPLLLGQRLPKGVEIFADVDPRNLM